MTAKVSEFEDQRNKMPGDRKGITAIDDYILELYFDPMGQRPRSVIEVNERDSDGNYSKVASVWFNTEDADERAFEDPEQAAKEAFNKMKKSLAEVEKHL